MNYQETQDAIAARAHEAQRILDAANARGGTFTDDEKARIKTLTAEVKRLNTDLGDAQLFENLQALGATLGMDRGRGLPSGAHPGSPRVHDWARPSSSTTRTCSALAGARNWCRRARSSWRCQHRRSSSRPSPSARCASW